MYVIAQYIFIILTITDLSSFISRLLPVLYKVRRFKGIFGSLDCYHGDGVPLAR